ncbi:hypothetical protein [Caudoviricetes sp.]|nr:hypothetical protein [Caudoviricetes sp.]
MTDKFIYVKNDVLSLMKALNAAINREIAEKEKNTFHCYGGKDSELVDSFLEDFTFGEEYSIDSRVIRNWCLDKKININYLYRILRKHGYNKFNPSEQKWVDGKNVRRVGGIREKFKF